MKDFKLDCPFDGNVAKAMDVAITILLPNGCRVLSTTAHEVAFKGPPMPQTAYQATQFWGASLIKLSHQKHALHLAVEMGELQKSNKIIAWIFAAIFLPVVLGVSFVIGSGAASDVTFSGTEAVVITSLVVAVTGFVTWVIRWSVRSWETKMKEAYQTLLANAAILGRDG